MKDFISKGEENWLESVQYRNACRDKQEEGCIVYTNSQGVTTRFTIGISGRYKSSVAPFEDSRELNSLRENYSPLSPLEQLLHIMLR